VARIVGAHHRSFAGAFDECPPVAVFSVVVVFAQRVELFDTCMAAPRVRDPMVDLHPGAGAALDAALW
jgi:hypothetical protein